MNEYRSTDLGGDERRKRTHACVDRLHAKLLAHDMDSFADEWAPGGEMSFPFAPPGWPHLRGREEVREYLADYADRIDLRGISHERRHDALDPDTMIIEWGVTGVVLATGAPYDIDYVAVLTVGDDGIESYVDYWSPLAVGTAMGGLDSMIAAFTGQSHG
jgi:ketosteroid isomerase-like protein